MTIWYRDSPKVSLEYNALCAHISSKWMYNLKGARCFHIIGVNTSSVGVLYYLFNMSKTCIVLSMLPFGITNRPLINVCKLYLWCKEGLSSMNTAVPFISLQNCLFTCLRLALLLLISSASSLYGKFKILLNPLLNHTYSVNYSVWSWFSNRRA